MSDDMIPAARFISYALPIIGAFFAGMILPEWLDYRKRRNQFQIKDAKKNPKRHDFDSVLRKDIAGLENIISKVDSWTGILNNLGEVRKDLSLPRGAILVGPPGVGKTYISDYMFSQVDGEIWKVVEGDCLPPLAWYFKKARNIRDNTGKGVILFKDEFDKKLFSFSALSEELDGINSQRNRGIFFLATANTSSSNFFYGADESLNSLYRPGRLELVKFGYPDLESKKGILRLNLQKHGVEYGKLDIGAIASMFPLESSGAYIKYFVEQILLKTDPTGKTPNLTDKDFIGGIRDILDGTPQQNRLTDEQKNIRAVHELGHYAVAKTMGYNVPFVSIEQNMESTVHDYVGLHAFNLMGSSDQLEDYMTMMVAGFVAEEIFEYKPNAGSINDVEKLHELYRASKILSEKHRDPRRSTFNGTNCNSVTDYVDIPKEDYEKYVSKAKDILTKHKDGIKSFTKKLADSGILTSLELAPLIQS